MGRPKGGWAEEGGGTNERSPLFIDLGTGAGLSSSSSSESAALGASFGMGSSNILRCFLAGGSSMPPPAPPLLAAGREPRRPFAGCLGAAAAGSSLSDPASLPLPYPESRSIFKDQAERNAG